MARDFSSSDNGNGMHLYGRVLCEYEGTGKLQYEADHFQIDAQRQKHVIAFLEKLIDGAIEDLRSVSEAAERSAELCSEIAQANDQTLLFAASLKG